MHTVFSVLFNTSWCMLKRDKVGGMIRGPYFVTPLH